MSKFDGAIMDAMVAGQPLDFAKATAIGEQFEVKPRAIVAAAIRAKLDYTNKPRVGKSGEAVVTKEALVGAVATALGIEAGDLAGLEKATKVALGRVVAGLEVLAEIDEDLAEGTD
jgi:hypothetical protein